jgi:AcrR family transcriptional regulator
MAVSTRRRRPAARSRSAAAVVGERAPGGQQHARLAEIQRVRLLAAAVRAVDELGYADTTVAHITSRARVSRRTFYELFADREACLVAALEDILGLIAAELAAVDRDGVVWRERVRTGLGAVLSFLDR